MGMLESLWGSGDSRVRVGDEAPDFVLPDRTGKMVRLSEFRGRKAVVLYFYPKDDTPGCTKESCAFRDSYQDFQDAGAEVIGVSSDSADKHAGFASKHRLPFTLLADQGGRVRKAYGVPAALGFIPGRVTYVIDRTGTVRHVFNSMTNIDGHVTEALEVVRQLQAEQPALGGLVGQYLAAELREHLGHLAQQVVAVGAAERVQVLPVPARLAAVGDRGPPRQRRDLGGEVGVEEEREGEPVPAAGVADPVRRRPVPAAGQPVEHVADVGHEGALDRRRVDPAGRRPDLQAAVGVLGQQGQQAVVGVLAHPPAVVLGR